MRIWTDTNWSLIMSIVLGSAVLAYLGDVLGFKYGKQRISIFGLRPKYTSRIITALTGIVISLLVLTVLAVFSENVRTSLFTMKVLNQQLSALRLELQNVRADSQETLLELAANRDELSGNRALLAERQNSLQLAAVSLDIAHLELDSLRNDRNVLLSEKNDLESSVASLRDESEEIRRELNMMRLGSITVRANSLLGQVVVMPGTSREELLKLMSSLNDVVRDVLAGRFSETHRVLSSDIDVTTDVMEESEIIKEATDSQVRLYIRALAAENIAAADKTVLVRLECEESSVVYREGDMVYRRLIDPLAATFNAEDTLHVFLRELKNKAVSDGVTPDPSTNSVGSLEGEDFFGVVEKLKNLGGPAIINAVAVRDIYTEGPVEIKIELQE